MPDELTINGVLYVRADKARSDLQPTLDQIRGLFREERPDDLLTVAEIRELTGKSIHAVNDAMNDGRLPYSVPNGCKRPRRSRRADVMAWLGFAAPAAG